MLGIRTESMIVLCTEDVYVNLCGFCYGGLDDGDSAGNGEDDGAGDTDDEHDNRGDEADDYHHNHQHHQCRCQRSVLAPVQTGGGSPPPPTHPPTVLHRRPTGDNLAMPMLIDTTFVNTIIFNVKFFSIASCDYADFKERRMNSQHN